MNVEIWKDIENFSKYQVSNLGNVKSLPRQRTKGGLLNQTISNCGYNKVYLMKDNKGHLVSVHRLVAQAFLTNYDENLEVNHINGIKTDNKVANLEMTTHSDNIKHTYNSLGRKQKTMKKIFSRDINGKILSFESKSDAIRYLKHLGYMKSYHSGLNFAIKNGTIAYDHKWSEKIIDLIEVGDYVNGYQITSIQEIEEPCYPKRLAFSIIDGGENNICAQVFNDKDIKSIVTKEQFESMEYKVGE